MILAIGANCSVSYTNTEFKHATANTMRYGNDDKLLLLLLSLLMSVPFDDDDDEVVRVAGGGMRF